MIYRAFAILFISLVMVIGCDQEDPEVGAILLEQAFIGSNEINSTTVAEDIPIDRNITLIFSKALDPTSISNAIILTHDGILHRTNLNLSAQNTTLTISPIGALTHKALYTLQVSNQLKGANGELFEPVEIQFRTVPGDLQILSLQIAGKEIGQGQIIEEAPFELNMQIEFSEALDPESLENSFKLTGPNSAVLDISLSEDSQTVSINSSVKLNYWNKYSFSINENIRGVDGEPFDGIEKIIYTKLDSTLKFPELSDEALITKVQEQTFRYFWDFAHPESGLIRERNTSGDLVTIGGSGFGVMAILVGIERGFITRDQGVLRLNRIVDFLTQADRFHGVWPHWMNGNSGQVIPFSSNDDGGDIVETAFMIQGLLTARQYLNESDELEKEIIDKINQLWEGVEWDWYTQGENAITWHWSPEFGFEKDLQVRGWNEALIVYVLAAASPTHTVAPEVYHEGWARNGGMVNGDSFYNITLPLGPDLGGPLFFEHYSFLGLDPRNLSDQYTNYWEQTEAHTQINRAYCIANPKNYLGYTAQSWGLTASDNHQGYSAHSPTNDQGVITPTAAISSFPYTPQASMEAVRHFYYILGDRLWGQYGFYDAFNFSENWVASSYLAIDQGPIIIMLENHRSGMLWDLFMTAPEIKNGLEKLGFNY